MSRLAPDPAGSEVERPYPGIDALLVPADRVEHGAQGRDRLGTVGADEAALVVAVEPARGVERAPATRGELDEACAPVLRVGVALHVPAALHVVDDLCG